MIHIIDNEKKIVLKNKSDIITNKQAILVQNFC